MESNCKVEKHLIEYLDVFADIVNTYIFNGKEEVDPEELTATTLHNRQYRMPQDDSLLQEGDAAMISKANGVQFNLIEVYEQNRINHYLPLCAMAEEEKCMGKALSRRDFLAEELSHLDGKGYTLREIYAMLDEYKNFSIFPNINIVLSYDLDHWRLPTHAIDCFEDVSDALKPLMRDYKVNVLEVAYLGPSHIERFHSDFRIIADYLWQMRTTGKYQAPDIAMTHPEETLQLLEALKKRFTNSADDFFAEPNISHIKKSVQELRDGKGDSHELIE